jgi:hypothetical protein
VFFIVAAGEAMLRAEERDELDAGRAGQLIDRAAAKSVLPSVIRDEADVLATQRREFFGFEDVDAKLHTPGAARRTFSGSALPGIYRS